MKTSGIFWTGLLVMISVMLRSQTQTVYLAPCFKIDVDTSLFFSRGSNFQLPPTLHEFIYRRSDNQMVNISSYHSGEGFKLTPVIQHWDSLKFRKEYENCEISQRVVSGFHICEIMCMMNACSNDISSVVVEKDRSISYEAWRIYQDEVILYVKAGMKQSTREKTISALDSLLAGIDELAFNELDKMLNLPWTAEECNARIQGAIEEYGEMEQSQFIKSASCGDINYDWMIRMEKGDAIVDSLIAAGKMEELAEISAAMSLRYFLPEIEKYYKAIQSAQFTFEESHNLRKKINYLQWTIEEIGRYYFDSTYEGLLNRANELYIYDYNPYQLVRSCAERDFAHDLYTYAKHDEICCPSVKEFEKFNTLLGRAIQREYFNEDMDVASVAVQQIGSLNSVSAQFRLNKDWETKEWFGAFAKGKDGNFQLVEITLPYNHYGERQILRNLWEDYSDDFLVAGNPAFYSDSLFVEIHLAPIVSQNLIWTAISIPASSSVEGSSLILNNMGFDEHYIPKRPLYDIYPRINVSQLDPELLQVLIAEMKSEPKRFVVRDTLPTGLKDQIWGVKWLKLNDSCFVDLYRFCDLVLANELASKIAYHTNLIFDDLDGDSIDEVFSFTVHNGRLVEYIMFAKTKDEISRVSGLKWKKLLKKSDYFINLSHHSMIGKHGIHERN